MAAATDNPHLTVRDDWLARGREEALEPALPIVDPHHHLWDRPGWPYLLDRFLADLGGGHNVVATVFLECVAMYRADGDAAMRPVGETEFANGIAAMSASGGTGGTRVCAGIVGYADLRLGARVKPVLEAHVAAAGGRFRGVRQNAAWHADPSIRSTTIRHDAGLLRDAGFRRGFAELAPLGLSYDCWLYHTQLHELADLAQAFPGTTVVLNHVGGPLGVGPYAGRRSAVFDDWRESLKQLAACANVVVKIGGLGMKVPGFDFHEKPDPPTSGALADAWRPYAEACIAAFGPTRCMFESNFPVDKGSCSYVALWNAFKRIAADCSPDEKAALFHDTAARIYRL